jgi:hypothetical protein
MQLPSVGDGFIDGQGRYVHVGMILPKIAVPSVGI